jgi:O-antigen/teichoic acid export membrane protein
MTATPVTVAEAEAEAEHPVLARLTSRRDLGTQVRAGFAWAGLFRIGFQILQFGSTLILARILLPLDYGLVTIVSSVTTFAGIFVDLGMTAAVIQAKRLTDELLATAFWLNLVMGVVLSVLVAALAYPLSLFYHQPRLFWLFVLAGLGFTLSESSVQSALLTRTMNFRSVGAIETGGGLVGLLVTIGCAVAGLGAVSLVLGTLVATLVVTVWYWLAVRWVPRCRPTRAGLRQLWRFGGGLTGFNIVNYWSRNTDNLLLGKFATPTDLGFYGRSYNLMLLPVTQLSSVVSQVLFPALAAISNDPPRLGRAWLRSVRVVWLLGVPVGLGIAASAPAMVRTLYGPTWAGMAAPLALLALSVPPQLVGSNLGPVFQAVGKTGLQFRIGLVTSGMSIAAVLIGLPWGIVGVAAALTIKSWVGLLLPAIPCLHIMDLRLVDLARSVGRIGVAGAAMFLGVRLVPILLRTGSAASVVFLVQLSVGLVVYSGLILALERPLLREAIPAGAGTRLRRLVPSRLGGSH